MIVMCDLFIFSKEKLLILYNLFNLISILESQKSNDIFLSMIVSFAFGFSSTEFILSYNLTDVFCCVIEV